MMPSIKHLDISGNGFGTNAAEKLAPTLAALDTLLTLRLNHHEIPVQVAKGIDSKGRKADVQSITGIEIEKYGEILPGKLRHKRRRGAVLTLSKEAGHTNSVFEKLEFVDAKVVDVDVVIISAMLAINECARKLRLFTAKPASKEESAPRLYTIGDLAMQYLCKALHVNRSIRKLLVGHWSGGNSITDKSAPFICTMLRNHNMLITLDLRNNLLGPNGCALIARCVRENPGSLKSLKLAGNRMGDTGAKEIGLLLRETTTLEKLDIGSNHITPLGASFVFAGLAENVGVDRFIFDSNSIGVEGCDALGKCLERNQYIGGSSIACKSDIGVSACKQIGKGLSSNKGLRSYLAFVE